MEVELGVERRQQRTGHRQVRSCERGGCEAFGHHDVADAHRGQQTSQAGGLAIQREVDGVGQQRRAPVVTPDEQVLEARVALVGRGVGEVVGQLPAPEGERGRVPEPEHPEGLRFALLVDEAQGTVMVARRHGPAAVERRSEHRDDGDQDRDEGDARGELAPTEPVAGEVDLEGRHAHCGGQGQAHGGGDEQLLGRREGDRERAALRRPGQGERADGERPAPHRPAVALSAADQERKGGGHEEGPAERGCPQGTDLEAEQLTEVGVGGGSLEPGEGRQRRAGQEEVDAPGQVEQDSHEGRSHTGAQHPGRPAHPVHEHGARHEEQRGADHEGHTDGRDHRDERGDQAEAQHDLGEGAIDDTGADLAAVLPERRHAPRARQQAHHRRHGGVEGQRAPATVGQGVVGQRVGDVGDQARDLRVPGTERPGEPVHRERSEGEQPEGDDGAQRAHRSEEHGAADAEEAEGRRLRGLGSEAGRAPPAGEGAEQVDRPRGEGDELPHSR